MSRLVLSRRLGESVMVGDLKLTVQKIESKRAMISGTWMSVEQWMPIKDCEITLESISRSQIKLAFVADPSVKIMRTELLKRQG